MRITQGSLSFTWEQIEDIDGEQAIRVSVTDRRSPVRTVDLVLTSWAPWEGDAAPKLKAAELRKQEGLIARDFRQPYGEYVETFASAVAEMKALAGDDRYKQGRQRRRRTKLTDEFLIDVLDTYENAAEGTRIAAVREKHPASNSQVYRWLSEARKRRDERGE